MGSSRIKSIVAVSVAALVLGVFTLSPVAAHFTTNTKHLGKHAWTQFIRKKVYNRKQADKRYLGSQVVVAHGTSLISAGSRGFVNVPCPEGHVVIGGGARFTGFNDAHEVNYNGPALAGDNLTLIPDGARPTAWQASAVNGSAGNDTLNVWAICSPSTGAPSTSLSGAGGGSSSDGDPSAPEFDG